jgi:hypothetical protein
MLRYVETTSKLSEDESPAAGLWELMLDNIFRIKKPLECRYGSIRGNIAEGGVQWEITARFVADGDKVKLPVAVRPTDAAKVWEK